MKSFPRILPKGFAPVCAAKTRPGVTKPAQQHREAISRVAHIMYRSGGSA